jgi:hypothetical protein
LLTILDAEGRTKNDGSLGHINGNRMKVKEEVESKSQNLVECQSGEFSK